MLPRVISVKLKPIAATLEDFQSLVNVFYFVCGLYKDGAVKVLTHLSSVRANDVSVDLSVFIPVEETETDLPWTGMVLVALKKAHWSPNS